MSAIFISYTGRDAEGDAWADRLAGWFEEWEYGYFRDKDHSHGIKAGEEWRPALYRHLALAQAMVCLCSQQYEGSPWCVGEVAIAVKEGKTVIPIHLLKPNEEGQSQPLPSMLQTRQAIRVPDALHPSPEQLEEVRHRLRTMLNESLKWRELQGWDPSQPPYPGLPAFEAHQAPVFFGRDADILRMVQQLTSLALSAPGFLLLLGASGYGKSSLVRAGVVPWLRAERQQRWLVLEPFKPGLDPFGALRGVLREPLAAAELVARDPEGGGGEADGLSRQLHSLSGAARAPVVLVIDQFEELLAEGNQEGERFLAFLEGLLSTALAEVVVLATMRTDFLAPLQSRWPELLSLATTEPLTPIRLEDFGELISGPAKRSNLEVQPGLKERLVHDSGGGDALPLLAFTLEKLWQKWKERGGPMVSPRGERWDLTVADYEALGGVAGAVSSQAKLCWNPETSHEADTAALREAFLDHLVTLNEEGQAAKRPAPLLELPERSRPIVERMVNRRLLVSDAGVVEIAHEALLRTWEPLVAWIEEGKVELLQCLRVRRLLGSLTPEAPAKDRRKTLNDLADLAAAGGSEGRAVQKEAAGPLAALLAEGTVPEADRLDAALVLALVGAEAPLRGTLADTTAPVGVRRRAAESLGLLAKRSGDQNQRDRIAAELEGWLRSDVLNVVIKIEQDPAVVAEVTKEVDVYVRQLAAAGRLEGMGEEQIHHSRENLIEQELRKVPCDSGLSPGWAGHDSLLPLLQGAARGLQLATSADLPLLGSGPGRKVPMLTLMALQEGEGLHIRTEVVSPAVWSLPLPDGEQLELVEVPSGAYRIGSPETEAGRDYYTQHRLGCDHVNVEVQRTILTEDFAMARHPITQAQWRAVATIPHLDNDLKASPSNSESRGVWQTYGHPGCLPVESVSWEDCNEWLQRLNKWLKVEWPKLGGMGSTPRLSLPGEGQWETACRAGESTPFHFGDTLDASWANYNGSHTFGPGRKGADRQRPVLVGSHGLVNRWGLADMHGQLFEWCGDQWHPNPTAEGWPSDGRPWEGVDPSLQARGMNQKYLKLTRGGSWYGEAVACRTAFRYGFGPTSTDSTVGFRPCCLLLPGSLLGS